MPITGLESLKAVSVQLNINNRSIMFRSAYQLLSRKMHISDYDKVMSLHKSIIIAGDLNILSALIIGAVVLISLTVSNYKHLLISLPTQYVHQMILPTFLRTLIDYLLF
ncbi:Reverse transcriptase domain-containing protein [Aphis craccivora]|uniref:Reverse transcriptase domain-containing protein n=1 Tax=Aphis craccivora TaxID=307492 RepID=A0A6G0Z384_APHCR|nr:Reverse transcriptase domain-containing protein [Aphis craccivora]